MRALPVLILLVALPLAPSHADPNDLSGGVFIAHYCEPLGYSAHPPSYGWCGEYLLNHAITHHSQQVNRVNTGYSYAPISWFVLAAWEKTKSFSAVELGLGDFNPNIFFLPEWDPCSNSPGMLYDPTSGWPGPNEGIRLVPDEGYPWEGNYVPVLWFGGYAYGYHGAGTVPIAENPASQWAGFSNSHTPAQEWPAMCLGALGIDMDGIACVPIAFGVHPCCIDEECLLVDIAECAELEGTFHLEWESCDPNPCLPGEAACCVGEDCTVLSAGDCQIIGGDWLPGVMTCEPNLCVPGNYLVRPDGSGDFPTIQSALDEVVAGDRIWLTDGSFLGRGNRDLDFLGKSVQLASLSDDPEACIILSWTYIPGSHRGIQFVHGEDSTAVVRGVTLEGAETPEDGGAVYCSAGSSPTFSNCIFNDNQARSGGALFCADESCRPTLRNCALRDNYASMKGGAICAMGPPLSIQDCAFSLNRASLGGGIYSLNGSLLLEECTFTHNHAAQGGAIHLASGEAQITNCMLRNNGSNQGGSAVFASESSLHFATCTLRGNVASGSGTISSVAGNVALASCTFHANRGNPCAGLTGTASGNAMQNSIIAFSSSGCAIAGPAPELFCCDIYGNAGGDWTANILDQLGVRGNITSNPWFCDPEAGDLHIQPHSACAPFSPPNEECDLIGAWPVGCEDILHACCVGHSCQMLILEDCDALGGTWYEWANTCDPNPCPPYLVLPDGSGAYATIRDAIQQASSGDTILLGDGIFRGEGNRNLGYSGRDLCIRSLNGNPEACVIDCQGSAQDPGRAFYFSSQDDSSSILENISIINGHREFGGALYCDEGSAPTLRNLRIAENHATANGGGIYLLGASPRLSDIILQGNAAEVEGGGLWCRQGSPLFSRLLFRGNTAQRGGGAQLYEYSLSLAGCEFLNNSAVAGAGLHCRNGAPTIEQVTFSGNFASHCGGGLACYQGTPTLRRATFYGNAAPDGGGIGCIGDAAVNLEECIIAFSTQGKAIDVGNPGYVPQLTCCDLYGNAGGDWTSAFASQFGHHGNICRDPLFCDPEGGDLRIHAHSPCSPRAPASSICGLLGAWPAGCSQIKEPPREPDAGTQGLSLTRIDPLGSSARFRLRVPSGMPSGEPRLEIFDAQGRRVRTLGSRVHSPGTHEITWDGRTDMGTRAPHGIYFCRLSFAGKTLCRKVVIAN